MSRDSVASADVAPGGLVLALSLTSGALLAGVAAIAVAVGDVALAAAIVVAIVAGVFSAGST